jgi:hypothetical protein
MMRIVVILAAIAAAVHHVSSRPQLNPFNPGSFLGGSNNNNNKLPFDCNSLNPNKFSEHFPVPVGGSEATEAPAEAGAARKRRSPAGFPFQQLIPTAIPNNCLEAFMPAGETSTVAKPSGV